MDVVTNASAALAEVHRSLSMSAQLVEHLKTMQSEAQTTRTLLEEALRRASGPHRRRSSLSSVSVPIASGPDEQRPKRLRIDNLRPDALPASSSLSSPVTRADSSVCGGCNPVPSQAATTATQATFDRSSDCSSQVPDAAFPDASSPPMQPCWLRGSGQAASDRSTVHTSIKLVGCNAPPPSNFWPAGGQEVRALGNGQQRQYQHQQQQLHQQQQQQQDYLQQQQQEYLRQQQLQQRLQQQQQQQEEYEQQQLRLQRLQQQHEQLVQQQLRGSSAGPSAVGSGAARRRSRSMSGSTAAAASAKASNGLLLQLSAGLVRQGQRLNMSSGIGTSTHPLFPHPLTTQGVFAAAPLPPAAPALLPSPFVGSDALAQALSAVRASAATNATGVTALHRPSPPAWASAAAASTFTIPSTAAPSTAAAASLRPDGGGCRAFHSDPGLPIFTPSPPPSPPVTPEATFLGAMHVSLPAGPATVLTGGMAMAAPPLEATKTTPAVLPLFQPHLQPQTPPPPPSQQQQQEWQHAAFRTGRVGDAAATDKFAQWQQQERKEGEQHGRDASGQASSVLPTQPAGACWGLLPDMPAGGHLTADMWGEVDELLADLL